MRFVYRHLCQGKTHTHIFTASLSTEDLRTTVTCPICGETFPVTEALDDSIKFSPINDPEEFP